MLLFSIFLFSTCLSIQFSSSSLCHPYSMLLWFFFYFLPRFLQQLFSFHLVLFTAKFCVSAHFLLRYYLMHKFYMSFTRCGLRYIYQMIRIDEGFVNVTEEINKQIFPKLASAPFEKNGAK